MHEAEFIEECVLENVCGSADPARPLRDDEVDELTFMLAEAVALSWVSGQIAEAIDRILGRTA